MFVEPDFLLIVEYMHTLAIVFLPCSIIWTESCADVSGKTQLLQFMVIATRYIHPTLIRHLSEWVAFIQGLQLSMTVLTIVIVFSVNRNYQNDSFFSEFLLFFAMVLAIVFPIDNDSSWILWQFSHYLEAVSMLPQMYMALKTKNISLGTAVFLTFMALSKCLFILNWLNNLNDKKILFYDSHISAFLHIGIFVIFLIFLLCMPVEINRRNTPEKIAFGGLKKKLMALFETDKERSENDRTPLVAKA